MLIIFNNMLNYDNFYNLPQKKSLPTRDEVGITTQPKRWLGTWELVNTKEILIIWNFTKPPTNLEY